MEMTEARHISISIDKEKYLDGINQLVQQLRPDWQLLNTDIQELKGGAENTTVKVVHNNNGSDGMVIRINSTMNEEFGISRERELRFIHHLNSRGYGIKLYASFDNGLVSKLVPGVAMDTEDLTAKFSDKQFASTVARMLAEMHYMPPDDIERSPDGRICPLIAMTQYGIDELKNLSNPDGSLPECVTLLDLKELEMELEWVYKELIRFKIPIGLCHNDVWKGNMLYEKETDTLNIIDYETMEFNFATYDLGCYLSQIPGFSPDKSKWATPEFTHWFIKTYLQERAELEGKPRTVVTERDIQDYTVWTHKTQLLFLLFNTPVALYLASKNKQGIMGMNMLEFAKTLYKQYLMCKEEYSHYNVPE